MPITDYDAVVLAGGRSSRMGVDKAGLAYRSKTLLQRSVEACATAQHIVVVAPDTPPEVTPRRVLEDPPFGGPVAGIAAGLDDLASLGDPAPWVLLLAVDYPEAPEAVAHLMSVVENRPDLDGYAAVDAEGIRQHLLALYRRDSLDRAVADLGEVRDRSVRSLVRGLTIHEIPLHARLTGDVDDPESARSFGIEVPHAP